MTLAVAIMLALALAYIVAKVYTILSQAHKDRVKYKKIKKNVFYARPWK